MNERNLEERDKIKDQLNVKQDNYDKKSIFTQR